MLSLPLERDEALLLRRVLEHAQRQLSATGGGVSSASLTRQAELHCADVIGNIRERLEALMLQTTGENDER